MSSTALTLNQALTKFQQHLAGWQTPLNTVQAYTTDTRLWLSWVAQETGKSLVSQLDKLDITEYVPALTDAGLRPTSVRRKLAGIRAFLRWGLEYGHLEKDIGRGTRSPRVREKEPECLNAQEYRALLYEASHHPRDLAILQTFLQTGMREGELIGLTLDTVDLAVREIRLPYRKGGVETVLPMPSVLVRALEDYLAVRPQVGSRALFLTRAGLPFSSTRAIRYLVKHYLMKAQILQRKPRAGVHTLRHTFGSHKASQGVDIAQLQYWMGHKKKETTYRYIHQVRQKSAALMEATSL